MSLAKLTSISTQTLSLLLERQRLQTITTVNQPTAPHTLSQITRNLNQLREEILQLEQRDGNTEAVKLLKTQFERMRGMLGDEGRDVEPLPSPSPEAEVEDARSASTTPTPTPQPPKKTVAFTPYTDEPPEPESPNGIIEQQRQLMEEQDTHLDRLSQSINRQRDVSIQINDELDVHTGLLQELDTEVDNTESRLRGARKRLDGFAKGMKANGSSYILIALIVILLLLIIIFKT